MPERCSTESGWSVGSSSLFAQRNPGKPNEWIAAVVNRNNEAAEDEVVLIVNDTLV